MRLPKTILGLVLLIPFFSTLNVLALDEGAIVQRTPYDFPSYEQAVQTTDVEQYTDRVSYEDSINDREFVFEKLRYVSDGLKVVAYVYRPKQIVGRNFPAIIFNRGSVVRDDIAPELISLFHRLATEGFVILAPMLRQSDGGEGRDEIGGADVNDLMNIVAVARSLGFIDVNNLFMYGESRGGMMTYQASKKGFPMNAAAVFGAFTDLQEVIDSHPREYPQTVLRQFWLNYDEQKNEIAKTRSAIFWTEQLNVPLLIMHGGRDRSVGAEQSLNLAQRLQKLGRVYELVVYAEDNHFLSRNHEDRDRRAVGWFKRHMKK